MTNELWPLVRLGELIHIKHGWPFKSELFSEDLTGRPIVVSIGNFEYSGGFRFESTTVKEYRGEYPEGFELSAGDILLVMTCQTAGGEILGIPARVPHDDRTYLHNQRTGKVEIKADAPVRHDFLYWLFLTNEFNRELVSTASGSKILHTAPTRIEAFKFRLPPPIQQEAIARILGTLDDKISLLRRMNQTLEETACALFKSWFVDFDPVRAKAAGQEPNGIDAETAKLFPGEFDSSKFGQVPKAWHYVAVRDVCDGLFDGPHATPPEADNGPVFLGIKNFRQTSLDLCDVKHISEADYPQWTKRVVPASQDIVFTYEATLGFFALIPPGLRCCLGRRTALVRPRKTERDAHFLFHWFIAPPFQEFLRAHRQLGSTVDRIWLKDFPGYPVLQPRPELIARFERFAGPMWAKIHANEAKSATLRSLRDTLLPKLLSGVLRIPDVERFLASEVRS